MIKKLIRDIVNGVFTFIYLIPAVCLIVYSYNKKQLIRVKNDILSTPSTIKRKIKRRK